MKLSFSLALLIATLGSSSAFANAKLAEDKNCMSCHSVAQKRVGPTFRDVAAKYAGQKDAADKLTQKVLNGSSGVWGPVFMPAMKRANPAVSDADARALVEWVLAQK